jgi:hypothetical protein
VGKHVSYFPSDMRLGNACRLHRREST